MNAIRALLLASISLSAFGQTPAENSMDLRAVLGLSLDQIAQLHRRKPPVFETRSPMAGPMAAERRSNVPVQQVPSENAVADQILNDSQRTKLKDIESVLHQHELASLAITARLISAREWAGPVCSYPVRFYASQLSLSDSQVAQLEQSREASNGSPHRSRAMAVLNDDQRVKLWEFEDTLDLAIQAIDLNLIAYRKGGESLCY